ncbi:MAG: hypothetical protein ACFFFT_16160, partial [Candidatus Thorarchaeota archaeon]
LYLFIFIVKFQGYIIESQILPIVVDETGKEIKNFESFILNIENYEKIFQFNKVIKSINLENDLIHTIEENAKKIIKSKTSYWKRDIKKLNEKIYSLERDKKRKIYDYNKRVLSLKLESLKLKLERKEKNRPTQRQLQNINNLKDEVRKQKKLQDIQNLGEEIRFIEKDIKNIEKKLDDFAFEQEDILNEMKRRNLAKFYTNLLSLAIIKIIK